MFNFVFYTSDWQFTRMQLLDILKRKDTFWIPGVSSQIKKPYKTFHRLHVSPRINDKINLPYKEVWFKKYFTKTFENNYPICFVFFATQENCDLLSRGYAKNLRTNYSDCKIVFCVMDRIQQKYDTIKNFDLKFLKEECDLVVTNNPLDAEEYNIKYYIGMYSKLNCKYNKSVAHPDILFVGLMKDRLETLYTIFEKATAEGYQCDFYITGVPKEKQKYEDYITFNNEMPYSQMIEKTVNSKCILDLMHRNTNAFTSRFAEAIFYDKFLLSNSERVKDSKYYNEKWMKTFKNPLDIDFSFINEIQNQPRYNYNGDLSPNKFLQWLEEVL